MNNSLNYSLLALLCSCFFLLGCNKRESSFTEVSGVVYEVKTKKPIPYAKVRFEWWDPGVYGEERYHVDSTTANAQGYYELAGDVPELQEYYVIADAPKYFETEKTERIQPNVERGQKQVVDLDLIPFAWVRMHITKTGKYNNMNINPPAGDSRGYSFLKGGIFVSRPVWGNWEVDFILFKYKNGLSERERITISTIGHDTVDAHFSF